MRIIKTAQYADRYHKNNDSIDSITFWIYDPLTDNFQTQEGQNNDTHKNLFGEFSESSYIGKFDKNNNMVHVSIPQDATNESNSTIFQKLNEAFPGAQIIN